MPHQEFSPSAPQDPAEIERLTSLYRERVAQLEEALPGSAAGYQSLHQRCCAPGELLVPPMAADLTARFHLLAQRGTFVTAPVVLEPGQPSHCHANVAAQWMTSAIDVVLVGYALGPGDGLWRPHSAGLRLPRSPSRENTTGKTTSGQTTSGQTTSGKAASGEAILVETTLVRDAYFGLALDGLSAFAFSFANCESLDAFEALSPERVALLHEAQGEIGALVASGRLTPDGDITAALIAERHPLDPATLGVDTTRPAP